jgi:hypothetical protein
VAARALDVSYNFKCEKNNNIANYSTTTKAIEKINTDLDTLKFNNLSFVFLAKFLNNKILLTKISHQFLVTSK